MTGIAVTDHVEDGGMSNSEEPPGAGEERQSFELALRGYDKRQVDQYIAQLDNEISTLAAERDWAVGEVKARTTQLQQLQTELTELHERPIQIDRASFRDLGPMVDQMLALAEKQAGAIVGNATQRATNREAEADRMLGEARDQATQMLRGLDAQLAARRAAADKAYEDRQSAAEAELAKIRELAEQTQAQGESAREQAEQEAHLIKERSAQERERAEAEAEALLEAARAQAEQELVSRRAELEQEIGERRTGAAQKIAALHAQAQQQADEVRQRLNEQVAAHQQQLAILQEEIQAQRQTLAELQSEMDVADQQLAQYSQKQAAMEHEVVQLQQRLHDGGQALAAEHHRLDEARRAGEAAEQHARDVRARVQREAKRVAELAAAAVMAAAAGGTDTGEFPRVVLPSGPDRAADSAAQPQLVNVAPNPGMPNGDGGHARPDIANGAPAPRATKPARLPGDVE
jgi:cell division septum initiation protein DivIVA